MKSDSYTNKSEFKIFFYLQDALMRRKGGRYFNFYALCVPWICINKVGIILDLTTFYIYFRDYTKLLWDLDHFLVMVEVKNIDVMYEAFKTHHSTIMYPIFIGPQFLAFVAAKFFVPLFFMLMFGLLSIKSMWEVIADNKRIQTYLRRV
jgi:hypothetical protein